MSTVNDPMIKPRRLEPGDRVAAVTLSWGGPGEIPLRYEVGKRQFEKAFGITVVEMEHTLADAEWIAKNPEARAMDLMRAFEDDSIAGIISTIGGDDSIRILPYLDLATIRANPKAFVGYSDSTVTHMACYKAGIVSFHGPALMTGFAENGGMHGYLEQSFRQILFSNEAPGVVAQNREGWTVEFLDWSEPSNQARQRALTPCTGWDYLQGEGVHQGHLIGGCLEVLEWMRGTEFWPTPEQWKGALLFLETSEEAPPPCAVSRALRVYAAEGVLEGLAGILFARPGGQVDPSKFAEYDDAILKVVAEEQGLDDLPIVTGMDFGHTDPLMTLPYGIRAEVDCDKKEFRIVEGAVRA